MKKEDKINEIQFAINEGLICNIFFKNCEYYLNLIPINIIGNYILFYNEYDFLINGFSIRKLSDIKKIKTKDDLCNKILKKEVTLPIYPKIDLNNWKTIFTSLKILNENIIIEKESLNKKDCMFWIGSVEKIGKNHVFFRHFDANGMWEEEPYKIYFKDITSISIKTRYSEIFSKYLDLALE